MKNTALVLLAAVAALTVIGCGESIGDTNPVTPEKMTEMRNKQNAERSTGKPPTATAERPPSNTP